jgi:hypothetical protein
LNLFTNSTIYDNGTSVGINTVNPSGKFHIESAVANNSYVLLSNPGNVIKTHIGVGNSDSVPFLASTNNIQLASGTFGWGFFDRGTDGFLNIQRRGGGSSWSSVMTIDRTNGNIGIGTGVQATTPPEKLTVDGNIRVADTTATQGNVIQFLRGGGGQYDYSIGKYGSAALAISLANDPDSQRALQVGYHSGATFNPKFHINGYTGDVGMGTVTPSGKLDVAGDVFVRGSGGTAGRINFKSGSFTDTILNIRSDTNGNIYMDGGGVSVKCGSQDGQLALNGYSTNVQIGHTYNAGTIAQHVRFTPGGSELMRMTNSGTIGIGLPLTNSLFNIQPFDNCRLHIMGSGANSASSALNVANSGNSSLLFVRNDGNVGIGTTTPAYKLEVNGGFAASTKSFRIHHPSKKDHSLEYGSLESPYHGVRLTGRDKVIKGVGAVSLPDYLKDLIHDDDTLNIQITNIKHGKTIYVDKIDLKNDRFIVKVDRAKSLGELQFFWTLTGVRKDVDHLVVEKEN